jgi:hypothetical protein
MDRVIIKKKKNKQKQKQKQKQEQKVIVNIGKEVLRRTKRRRTSKPKEPKGESFIPQPRELPPVVFQIRTFQQQVQPSLAQQLPVPPVAQEEDKKVKPSYYSRADFKGFEDVGQMKTDVSFPEKQQFPEDEEVSLVQEKKKRGPKKGSKQRRVVAEGIEAQQALPVVSAIPFQELSVKPSNLDTSIPTENPLISQLRQPTITEMFNQPQEQPTERTTIRVPKKNKYINDILFMTGETDTTPYEMMTTEAVKELRDKMKAEGKSKAIPKKKLVIEE